mmetsp:Transcript_52365/g.132347  ORF Transcript_52365/g.132347 Transcript_52365/m.132347 type:complete len:277 (-) Transcript_52365:216-1046(-)
MQVWNFVEWPEKYVSPRGRAVGRELRELLGGGLWGLRACYPLMLASPGCSLPISRVDRQKPLNEVLGHRVNMAPATILKLDVLLELRRWVEGRITPEHPEGDEADAEQVHGLAVVPAVQDLRRVPPGGTLHATEAHGALAARPLCEAEVAELHHVFALRQEEQEVVRLDVAVDDTQRRAAPSGSMDVPQRCQHLSGAISHLSFAVGLAVPCQLPQVPMRSVRRDQEHRSLRLLGGQQSDDVRVRGQLAVDLYLRLRVPPLLVAAEAFLQEHLHDNL